MKIDAIFLAKKIEEQTAADIEWVRSGRRVTVCHGLKWNELKRIKIKEFF